MSTITAPRGPSAASTLQPLRRGVGIAVTALVVIAAAIALSVWLFVQSPTHHAKVVNPPVTTVQNGGAAYPGANPECFPVPGKHFC